MTPEPEAQADAALLEATQGLAERTPELSAQTVLTRPQTALLAVIGVAALVTVVVWPLTAARIVVGVVTACYLATLVYRVLLFAYGADGRHLVRVSDAKARAVPDADLPRYLVLVPAFHEPHVGDLVGHLADLDYPRDKLDVRLMLEADDHETIAAAEASNLPPHVTVVRVPPSDPRTKPKACNYGLVGSDSDLVTIYDAEDKPEPLQLRRAAVALERLGPEYACVQAQLSYFNSRQNLLTKWFTIEYGMWFAYLLPGLVALGAPVPLGGTSNHFRTKVLRDVGAWDPFNVTEDADLGMRLHRAGHRVGVLDSVTMEEANCDEINWIKQRSRWYKGYLQTFLVHVRQPVAVMRELGWRGLAGLVLFVAGTPALTACNALMWFLTLVWFTARSPWVAALFPAPVYYLGLLCFAFGNAAVLYMNVFATRHMKRPDLLGAALLVLGYWVLMSVAAVKAAVQLVVNPSYWEKTTHGLHKAAQAHESQETA